MKQDTMIAVDFGGTSIKLATVSGSKIIEKHESIQTPLYDSAQELQSELINRLQQIKSSDTDQLIKGVGIGVPGLVKQPQGLILSLGNVPGWTNVALSEKVAQALEIPCKVDNDANCAALAEARFGAGKNESLVLMVTLGTGVGSGIIKDGYIWHGAYGYAGEIGRLQVPNIDPETGQVTYEILDKICGHSAISQRAKALYEDQGVNDDLVTKTSLPYLAQQARQSDPLAKKVWQQMAQDLALGLANANALLNPSMIIVGGGVAAAADVFLSELTSEFKSLSWAESLAVKIAVAQFGNDAGLIGAAQLCEQA